MSKVWLITGCSTGFGRALAKEVLAKGYRAAVAARNTNDVQDIIEGYPSTAIAVKLDVTVPEQIKSAVQATIDQFGQIDVLVNNAGIGYFAAIEESEEAEIRRMFEINFFGLAQMTQEVLPHMRKRKAGHILNITSIGGLRSFPGIGFFNASKNVVDGFSGGLSKKNGTIGIKINIISSRGFPTDLGGGSAKENSI